MQQPSGSLPSSTAPPAPSSPRSAESSAATNPPDPTGPASYSLSMTRHESFDRPWAMTALPGTDLLAITERGGALKLRGTSGVRTVTGTPEVAVTDQGGMGDIIAGPTFATDGTVYLSWVEKRDAGTAAVVAKAVLDTDAATLTDVTPIWRQVPGIDGGGHYSHRLAIGDGHLFITSGDRRQFSPAQGSDTNLGKILRLTLDGRPAPDNPFADGPVSREFWSIGHRNPLGLAFDGQGRLWSTEMGPKGGDELNLIEPGLNYGWPEASNGSNYDGTDIPDHSDGDGFEAPRVSWNPSISPSSLMIYNGDLFKGWQGDAFVGALSGRSIIRIALDGTSATIAETWPMDARIREVEQGSDGAIWFLEDGPEASLVEIRPA